MAQSLFGGGSLRPLRPRQADAIQQIRDAIRQGHKRIIVQAPTGFGKTLTAAHIIAGALKKRKRPLFAVPAIALVNQTLEAFEAEGIRDIGIIQAQHERTDWDAPVQIASILTLIRRPIPPVDFLIIDEVHSSFKGLDARLDSEQWKDKIAIGLSATPWSRGLGNRWTKLIIAATVEQLIGEQFLCPFVVYAPTVPDTSKVPSRMNEYGEMEFTTEGAANVMDTKKITADVVSTWVERAELLPTFLFAVNRKHAQSLRDEFQSVGISCGYIDAFSTPDERTETFKRFRDGRDQIIASVECLTTGVDEDVRCIIDAAPTRSEIRHVQKIGRGLRMADGKRRLIILDHAGNSLRLGCVTDIYHDRLDTRKPGDKKEAYEDDKPAPKPKKCKCGALIPPGKKQCPACGAILQVVSEVETEAGELVLLGSGKKGKTQPTMADKQHFYSGLLGIAKERGYSDGWVAHKYRAKFTVWPRGLEKVAIDPPADVRSFEQSQRIRFAKAREKATNSTASASIGTS